jgi:hypothetical protein
MRTDRELSALFAGAVVDEAPDPTFLDELFAVLVDEVASLPTSVSRPRPARRVGPFGVVWRDEMNRNQSRIGLVQLAAAVVALIVVVAVLASAGGLFKGPVVVSPTPAAPSSPVPPSATAPATAPASSAPFVRDPEPGTAIPDSMLGSWFVTSGPAFPWIYRAGSPYCVKVLSSSQDCMAWQQPDGRTTYGGVLTIIGDTLAIRFLNGSGCRNSQAIYHFTVTPTALTLIDDGGGTCTSGDYHFTRAGTGSAPTAPPEPRP